MIDPVIEMKKNKLPSGDGPSWLMFIGHMKDSLWSRDAVPVDLFRCESITLKSHPFIERVIGTTRREYLDRLFFFNELDLQRKLNHFQVYYNEDRVHSSLNLKTPKAMANENPASKGIALIEGYRWDSCCSGLYQLPVAA